MLLRYYLLAAAVVVLCSVQQSRASTYNLPLYGDVIVAGPIPSPVTITINLHTDVIFGPYEGGGGYPTTPLTAYSFQREVDLLDNSGVAVEWNYLAEYANPGGPCCVGAQPSIEMIISDSNRRLRIGGGGGGADFLYNVTSFSASITADLPLGLYVTPIGATLPLFVSGLGALGLLGCWRKRKTRGAVA